ncbi:hypothetical protein BpHYR1_040117 [Brachionus plicatilis]|uniref:Gustatory receptor n=1 Tax=Brachionus plicatilis TaxID=10195 RepID=A0A3M7T1F3_BRAPC|nr:hypothetical protein BpHYR1_040117 [Brachionus plicatilis]
MAYGTTSQMFEPRWAAYLVEAVALLILNSVYLAVVINHVTQCEMIIFYVNEIRTRLEEKSINLKDSMQQILDIRMAIGNLNSTVSKMTTLVTLTFLEKFMIGVMILIINQNNDILIWVYRISFCLVWFSILAFTLIEVARLNSNCNKFKQIALSARVYGYHASSRDELDSFLLFVANAKIKKTLKNFLSCEDWTAKEPGCFFSEIIQKTVLLKRPSFNKLTKNSYFTDKKD